MANNNEPAKLLIPYLQRADELQNHDPVVSYYCRLYAMERGLKIPQSDRTKNTNSLLVTLLKLLEKDKKSLKLSPHDDRLHLEGFALNVFAKADKQDRARRADINTAKAFYAASIFFEILNQFGELAQDLEQKQKYAVWKAAAIRKALRGGRRIVPGTPGSERDSSTPSAPSGDYEVEPRQTGHDIIPGPELDRMPSAQFSNALKRQSSTDISPSHPSFPSGDYPSCTQDNVEREENSTCPQPYETQTYPQESQNFTQVPQNYHSQDIPAPNSYPNFLSYPSFPESSLPAVAPSHHPSYYQGSDASYSHQSNPSMTDYASAPLHSSSDRNESEQVQDVPTSVQPPTSSQTNHYDSKYQPPPENIAEAHKAARFAVGALAFDEVPVAVEHLKKALEYLSFPSAGG